MMQPGNQSTKMKQETNNYKVKYRRENGIKLNKYKESQIHINTLTAVVSVSLIKAENDIPENILLITLHQRTF